MPSEDNRYLTAQQLQWYLQLDENPPQGKWADMPTDYGIDFEQLDRLQKRSLFRPSDFPHSFLDPDFMFEPPQPAQPAEPSQDG